MARAGSEESTRGGRRRGKRLTHIWEVDKALEEKGKSKAPYLRIGNELREPDNEVLKRRTAGEEVAKNPVLLGMPGVEAGESAKDAPRPEEEDCRQRSQTKMRGCWRVKLRRR